MSNEVQAPEVIWLGPGWRYYKVDPFYFTTPHVHCRACEVNGKTYRAQVYSHARNMDLLCLGDAEARVEYAFERAACRGGKGHRGWDDMDKQNQPIYHVREYSTGEVFKLWIHDFPEYDPKHHDRDWFQLIIEHAIEKEMTK